MKWNLERFYKETLSESLWDKDFAELQHLYKGNVIEEAEELESYLWTYAYARVVLDERDKIWSNKLNQLENICNAFVDDLEKDEWDKDVQKEVDRILAPLQNRTYNGLRSFEAATSHDQRIRYQHFHDTNQYYQNNSQELSLLLLQWVKEQKNELISNQYLKVRDKFISQIPYFHGLIDQQLFSRKVTKLSWYDLHAQETCQLQEMNLEIATQNIHHIFHGLHEDWSEIIQYLFMSGSVEANYQKNKKRAAAFSLPVAFHNDPLCYIHSVTNRESFFGLLHEVAHGLHFYRHRKVKGNYKLPDTTVLEIFPIAMDMYTSYTCEGESGLIQRIMVNVLLQFLMTEFIYQLIQNTPEDRHGIQEVWMNVSRSIFGNSLEMDHHNYLWCGSRLVWSYLDEGISYVFGGVIALELFQMLKEGGGLAIQQIDNMLLLPPTATIDDWNNILTLPYSKL